jgi:uridine phosphorylase
MGTPSLEIVLNEIVALNEIDFSRRTRKEEYDMLNIIRIGTSGGIQAGIDLGTLIITDYAVGLDNTGSKGFGIRSVLLSPLKRGSQGKFPPMFRGHILKS